MKRQQHILDQTPDMRFDTSSKYAGMYIQTEQLPQVSDANERARGTGQAGGLIGEDIVLVGIFHGQTARFVPR